MEINELNERIILLRDLIKRMTYEKDGNWSLTTTVITESEAQALRSAIIIMTLLAEIIIVDSVPSEGKVFLKKIINAIS